MLLIRNVEQLQFEWSLRDKKEVANKLQDLRNCFTFSLAEPEENSITNDKWSIPLKTSISGVL